MAERGLTLTSTVEAPGDGLMAELTAQVAKDGWGVFAEEHASCPAYKPRPPRLQSVWEHQDKAESVAARLTEASRGIRHTVNTYPGPHVDVTTTYFAGRIVLSNLDPEIKLKATYTPVGE